MCTLIAFVDVVPGIPIALAANRDEMYDRPARAPVLLAPGLVGGLDLKSGGSWLAIARDGRFCGVTNQREAVREVAPRSRGELVVALAQQPDRAAMRAYVEALDPTQYASGNLLFGDVTGADIAYVRRAPVSLMPDRPSLDGRSGTVEIVRLEPGVHVLTNDRLGSPEFPKAQHADERLAPFRGSAWSALRGALPGILGDHTTPPPDRIPPLPVGSPVAPELAAALQALCIHTQIYGTRSATIAAITSSGTETLLWADGPPCVTPFVDAMPLYA